MSYFPEVKKNFGFGCMRLPRKGPLIDYEQSKKMIDTFRIYAPRIVKDVN